MLDAYLYRNDDLQFSHLTSQLEVPKLGVSEHLEVNGTNVTSKHPTQSGTYYSVLPIFAGTIFTSWSGEAVIYRDTAQNTVQETLPTWGLNPSILLGKWE